MRKKPTGHICSVETCMFRRVDEDKHFDTCTANEAKPLKISKRLVNCPLSRNYLLEALIEARTRVYDDGKLVLNIVSFLKRILRCIRGYFHCLGEMLS